MNLETLKRRQDYCTAYHLVSYRRYLNSKGLNRFWYALQVFWYSQGRRRAERKMHRVMGRAVV